MSLAELAVEIRRGDAARAAARMGVQVRKGGRKNGFGGKWRIKTVF